MMLRFVTFISVVLLASPLSNAFSASDPCRQQYVRLISAQRRVEQAERRVSQAQDNLVRRQDQVEMQLASYQSSVDNAWARVEAARAISNGYATGCIVRTLFGGGYGCVSGSISSGITRRATATAAYNSAVARRNSYSVYAQGFVRRQAEQVVTLQTLYNGEVSNYQKAQADYQACQPVVPN